jgi:hypothetical protein
VRRWTILGLRALLAGALGAAFFDVAIPARSAARVRLHLIDRSGSVAVPGPPESLTLPDADRIRRWDQEVRPPGDTSLWASFGREALFESAAVDPGGTNLEGALRAALGRNPTEIVLYTDGRGDPGAALFLCRARNLPVHVFPLGPVSVRDARISAVRAPPEASLDDPAVIEVLVESTFAADLPVRMGEESRVAAVGPGAPALVSFRRPPGRFTLRLEVEDACPQNNEASGDVLARASRRRVLALSAGLPDLPRFDVRTAPRFENPQGYDAVVLDNIRLSGEEQRVLAAYVRDLGGGLLLLGGRQSFFLGGWTGTALDEISPLRSEPDHRVAVVFAVDASGSMSEPGKLDAIVRAILDARALFAPGDVLRAVAFADDTLILDDLDRLRSVRASGGTFVARGLSKSRLELEQLPAGRKHVVLLTDGETAEKDTPELRQAERGLLREAGIGLTVVTAARELPELGPNLRLSDWRTLASEMRRMVAGLREVEKANPGEIDFREHPATREVGKVELPWMNLTTARPHAQVAGTVGRPPAAYPAVAFSPSGRGRTGAFAFEMKVPRLLEQAIDYVAGEDTGGLSLTLDPPVVRARGSGPPRIEVRWQATPSLESGALILEQVRSDLWEGRLPETRPGTVYVTNGRARAAATIPGSAEYRALGVDRKALERIASETGGRVLRAAEELVTLPRPAPRGRRNGRLYFLAAALLFLFLDLAATTFWKA